MYKLFNIFLLILMSTSLFAQEHNDIIKNSGNRYEKVILDTASGYFVVKSGNMEGLLNPSGREIIPPTEYNSIRCFFIKEGYVIVVKDKALGLTDLSGRVILTPGRYKSFDNRFFKEGYVSVNDERTFGLCDNNGVEIIPLGRYTDISLWMLKDGFIITKKEGKTALCDKSGKELIPPVMSSIYLDKEEGFIKVEQDGKKGIFNLNCKVLIDPIYSQCLFYDSFFHVEKDGKKGLIAKDGHVVLPAEMESILIFDKEGYILVNRDGKSGVCTMDGKYIVEPVMDKLSVYQSEGYIYIQKDGKQGLLDIKGKEIIPPVMDKIYVQKSYGYIKAESGNTEGIYTYSGNAIIPVGKYTEISTFYAPGKFYEVTAEGGKRGLCDLNGNLKIPAEHSMIIYDDIDHYIRVRNGDTVGAYDTNGRLMIPCIYTGISCISGRFEVQQQKNGPFTVYEVAGYTPAKKKSYTQTEKQKTNVVVIPVYVPQTGTSSQNNQTTQQPRKVQCSYCNGTGRRDVIKFAPSYGGNNEWCTICRKVVAAGHYHDNVRCIYCNGTGYR
ncbi:MAG: WG repeat-containing protein [Bacteroidales bacterium]|nr:WG repeat-containing protein [Bacteroidales bacterium]